MLAQKIDLYNQNQQTHFLEQGMRKYHGKLETKYDRMVLGIY